MKTKKQKGFWKCEHSLIDRFKDLHELLLYFQMRCLAGPDREGRIHMDTEALAARIKWKLEHLAPVLARLMEPDPKSRCTLAGGACVAFIDPERPELGFWIPGVRRHRKKNAVTEKRRAYKAKKEKEYRARKRGHTVDTRGQCVDKRGLPTPSSVDTRGQNVDKREQRVDCEGRMEKGDSNNLNSKSGGSTLQPPEPSNSDWEFSLDKAIELINRDVLSNAVTKKMWSRLALEHLLNLMPTITEDQIFTVGFYWTHERDPKMPELERRPSFGLEKILEHWTELLVKATAFDKHHYPSTIKYPDPLKEREQGGL